MMMITFIVIRHDTLVGNVLVIQPSGLGTISGEVRDFNLDSGIECVSIV